MNERSRVRIPAGAAGEFLTSATSLCKQASRHYANKTSVTSLSKQDKRHVIIQTRQASRHYANKTSVTSLSKQDKRHVIIQTRQASRHYPNKRPNPSTDTPHRTGTLGMNMYTSINYLQCVQEWIVVVQLQIALQGFCPPNAEWRMASLCRTLSSSLQPSRTETVWRGVISTLTPLGEV